MAGSGSSTSERPWNASVAPGAVEEDGSTRLRGHQLHGAVLVAEGPGLEHRLGGRLGRPGVRRRRRTGRAGP